MTKHKTVERGHKALFFHKQMSIQIQAGTWMELINY